MTSASLLAKRVPLLHFTFTLLSFLFHHFFLSPHSPRIPFFSSLLIFLFLFLTSLTIHNYAMATELLPLSPTHIHKKTLTKEERIRKAILNGNASQLRHEFEDGEAVDVNWQDQSRATFLHHAAFRGNIEVRRDVRVNGGCVGEW
jgi:hypothetical protein